MGFFDKGISGARDRQKQAIIAEAGQAGMQVLNVVELADGVDATRAAVGSSLKALFGGSMQVDCVQVFSLQTNGWPHTYAQPYAIGQQHPEMTGTCYGQIGAALFFLKQYPQAIQYYQAAKEYGEDPATMDKNIAEAQAYLR